MMAYSSIIFGFNFAFALLLPNKSEFNHMIIRMNTIMSMLMGEVDLSVFPTSQANATNPYKPNFWNQWQSTDFVAHIIFFVFCFTVSIVVFNILTAFAIKVLINLYQIIKLIDILVQDVEEVLRDAEINKLMKQADYISLVEQSWVSR